MGIWEDILKARDQLAFAEIVRQESKRTVFCRPEQAAMVRWQVEQAGAEDVITVVESDLVAEGSMYVADEQSLDAGMRESLSKTRFGFY